MKKWKPIKLSWQYFFSYLLVMLTAMVLPLVYVYNSFYEFHSRILLGEYRGRLELLRETQETELNNLLTINNLLANSEEAEQFDCQCFPDRGDPLIQKIKQLKAANQYIHSLYLRFYDGGYVFRSCLPILTGISPRVQSLLKISARSS